MVTNFKKSGGHNYYINNLVIETNIFLNLY